MGDFQRGLNHILRACYTSTIYYPEKNHLNFSKIVLNNWGRGRGECLCIHFGEKLCWGMLLLKKANNFDGINPDIVRENHKYHISKAVGIAIVEMDFEGIL